ncbi:MAG: undecaprenyl/decaprenyl-phosphate alpha-N-acetylglucosaminyl 1-phosphate transferase [Phycisphaeraceae bacterium]|nr:undecaprenyl/decaprenyl-phosphate alpha-N-acetylglucosaminyl 1-phosphate transferase [Phycisphaeraceae bacterium]
MSEPWSDQLLARPGASADALLREGDIGLAEQASTLEPFTKLDIFHNYVPVFVIAFLVAVLVTPIMRRIAVANGVIDRPSDPRKIHKAPVAYMGGVAVYLGILSAIAFSYVASTFPGPWLEFHVSGANPVPLSILAGLTIIAIIGLIDDVAAIDPRLKIGGQLLAAAMLAMDDVGVKVARGVLAPIGAMLGNRTLTWDFTIPDWLPLVEQHQQIDLVYWAGTAIIALFVLGACNASNLLDGLDGLLTGVTAIAMTGLLFIALALAESRDGPLDAARLVIIMATLGACLGFLPHNFNPAVIFLGDCGSMLLGFITIVVILTLGDTGRTPLVVAGLIIYAVPIIDTTLAIIRRKMAGKPLSAADDQHLHHQLKRAMGVKGAVLILYAIGSAFALLGVAISMGRGRDVYVIALVFASFIIVTAIKIAHRQRIEQEAALLQAARAGAPPVRHAAPPPQTPVKDAPKPAPTGV